MAKKRRKLFPETEGSASNNASGKSLPLASLTAEDLIRLEKVRIIKRIDRLRTWVEHETFAGARRNERNDARREVRSIHDDLVMLKLRQRSYESDLANMQAAFDWVKADKAETTNELYTTMSKIIPINPGETPEVYYQRLRDIREAFANLEVPTNVEETF